MAASFVQNLLSGASKTAAASFQITGSKTVTIGNTIFVAFGSDDVGSNFSLADNLLNTYTQVSVFSSGAHAKVQLWISTITVGGTLTQQTMSWTTNITAKGMVSGEFAGVGTLPLGASQATGSATGSAAPSGNGIVDGLAVYACAVEAECTISLEGSSPGFAVSAGAHECGDVTTTAGGGASNIETCLAYALCVNTNVGSLSGTISSGSASSAGLLAIYNPAAAANPEFGMNQPDMAFANGALLRY